MQIDDFLGDLVMFGAETAGTSRTVHGAGLGSESTEKDANQSLDKEVENVFLWPYFDAVPPLGLSVFRVHAVLSQSHAHCMTSCLTGQVTKFARSAATTFAPRASGATKNPAYKGVSRRHFKRIQPCC
jgi:hypothetical protein